MCQLIALLFVSLAAAHQQADMRALLEQALDQPADLAFQNVKLRDLFEVVKDKTGVEVVMRPDTMALLPYGPETTIDQAEIRNVPLRQGLEGLIGGLGMMIVVQRDHIEAVPKPPLLRIGRPAQWKELDVMGSLAATAPGVNGDDLMALRERIQFQVPQPAPWETLMAAVQRVGAGPGDEVLEVACQQVGWTWYPQNDRLVVLTRQAQFSRQLQTSIRLRIERRPLLETMQTVGAACGVPIKADPGALASVPHDLRNNFSLTVDGYTAAEALEALAAPTGLGYMVTPEGVVFYNPATGMAGGPGPADEPALMQAVANGGPGRGRGPGAGQGPGPGAGGGSSDPVVGLIPVMLDGKTIYMLLRASEVPPGVQPSLDEAKRTAIEALKHGLQPHP